MSGIARRIHRDGGALTFAGVQDVEPILDSNRDWRNGSRQRGDFRKVASIPMIVIEKWLFEEHARGNIGMRMGTPEFDDLVRRKLTDPDWAYLKTQ